MTRGWLQRGGGWILAVLPGAVLALAGLPAGAQAADQDLMAMPLEDLARVQVYSASRHLEDARKAPSSVSVITREDIRTYGWRTLAEALESLRGFYISDNRQYTYLGVRGFMRPGDDNPRILLLVNGHRLNDRVYDTAAIGTEFPLDLDLIDHIEVVRGPGSSLYGTNAIFGVINVITREPEREAAVETTGDAGSLLSRTGSVTAMGSRGGVSGLMAGSLYRTAGNASLFFPVFAAAGTNNGYAENADGAHFEDAFAELRWKDLHVDSLIADRIREYPTGADGSIFDDPADRVDDARGYVDASLQRNLGAATAVELKAHYDAYNFVGSGDYGVDGWAGSIAGRMKARADWLGVEATVTQQMGAQRITGGGEYEYSLELEQRTSLGDGPALFQSKEKPKQASVFADAELQAGTRVIVHAGARLDKVSGFDASVSPRAAVIYLPDERTAVKYVVGKAFRDPNGYEEYYADGITLTKGPRSLVPEQIVSNEAIVERSLKPWFSVTGDAFYNQLKDLIEQVPAGDTTLSYYVNDDEVNAKGLEAEVDAGRETGWGARASYTATTAEDGDGPHAGVANAPHSQARLNASVPAGSRGTMGFEMVYVSAQTDERGTRVAPYLLPSVTFSTKPVWGGWQFSSSCYDATNRRWSSPAGPNDPEDQIPMDGRGWRFRVAYRVAARGGGREP